MKQILLLMLVLSFPLISSADPSCYNDLASSSDGLTDSKKELMEKMKNPAKDLLFCHLQVPFVGPKKVLEDCACKKAIKELCSFRIRDFRVKGPGQCLAFAPWNL